MKIVLFEDHTWQNFAPLIYARPLFTLRCGAYTAYERLAALVQSLSLPNPPRISGLCRPYLMDCYDSATALIMLMREGEPIVLVNGRALTLDWLPDLIKAPIGTVYQTGDTLLAAHLSPALASTVLYYIYRQQTQAALEELQRFAPIIDQPHTLMLNYPWDMIAVAGEQIVRDMPLLAQRLPVWSHASHPDITVRGVTPPYIAPTAQLDGPLVLDTRDGPIFIDEYAHIEPFSFLQGLAYIRQQTLISSSLIRGETSIGPVCRIGGEVEGSTIQGYTNKHHEGFLGHSWLGEWVNIGAMTTTSDLKNTYSTVRVTLDNLGTLDSGSIKLGAFLADHVKIGIGLHLTGGAVVGLGSNIYGIHMVPKNVPPFTWGGEPFHEYRIDSMISVTKRVMGRRKQTMSPEYERMLRTAFAMTYDQRSSLLGTVPLTPPLSSPVHQQNVSLPGL